MRDGSPQAEISPISALLGKLEDAPFDTTDGGTGDGVDDNIIFVERFTGIECYGKEIGTQFDCSARRSKSRSMGQIIWIGLQRLERCGKSQIRVVCETGIYRRLLSELKYPVEQM